MLKCKSIEIGAVADSREYVRDCARIVTARQFFVPHRLQDSINYAGKTKCWLVQPPPRTFALEAVTDVLGSKCLIEVVLHFSSPGMPKCWHPANASLVQQPLPIRIALMTGLGEGARVWCLRHIQKGRKRTR